MNTHYFLSLEYDNYAMLFTRFFYYKFINRNKFIINLYTQIYCGVTHCIYKHTIITEVTFKEE